jgi:Domain of unknown function (DUF4388)
MARDSTARSWTELQFSPEQRSWFGIDQHESLRVLSTGARTILLERTGGPSFTALPWDRDLMLSADVRAFSLADVLHLLHASAKSGFLFFEHRDHAKSIYIHRGEVVFAASNQQVDRLGEVLLRVGVITPEQFREAKQAYSPNAKFGRVLVERGVLSPRELWAGVKAQVEEIVRSLFSYGAGQVLFWEGEVRPDNVVRLSLPTRKLIAEGLRRRDELLKFLAWLEDPRVKLEAVPGFELAGTEKAVFSAIAAGDGFAATCRYAHVDPLSGARTLQLLRLLGAVRATRADDAEGDARRSDSRHLDVELVRECVTVHLKLLAELCAPIVAVEGGEKLRERLMKVVVEAAVRYPELLTDLPVGFGGAIDPDRLMERAIRFPGEREREVRLALGELVSYLEFELLNHPQISDPEEFIEGLEPLRASL